jgi:hypothetical protein
MSSDGFLYPVDRPGNFSADYQDGFNTANERADERIRKIEAEIAFWIECTGLAVDALDECAGDDEEGWDRQQHAENAAARIRAKYQDR